MAHDRSYSRLTKLEVDTLVVGTTFTAPGGANVVAGDETIGGNLIFSGATAKVIPGATSLTIRNHADSASNIAILDNGDITLRGSVTMADAKNIILNATTGSKIGTATTQKLGFFNATPVVQPAASADVTGFVAGSGTASKSDSVWAGASGASAYTVGGLVTALKALGLIAA